MKNAVLGAIVLFASAFAFTFGTASAQSGPQFSENFFDFGDRKYFTINAPSLTLLTFGEKKGGSVFSNGRLVPDGQVARRFLPDLVRISRPVPISYSALQGLSFANLTSVSAQVDDGLAGVGSGPRVAQRIPLGDSRLRNVDLVALPVGLGDLSVVEVLNTQANVARARMKDEGNDARIASLVWLVVEAQVADALRSAQRLDVTVGRDGSLLLRPGVGATGRRSSGELVGALTNTPAVAVAPGLVLAYLMNKVDQWEGDQIVSTQRDYYDEVVDQMSQVYGLD